jgi:ribosomal protein S21
MSSGYRKIELGFLVDSDPDAARAQIIETYQEQECNALTSADALGVAYRTFWRYVDRLKIHKQLEQLQRKAKKADTITQVRKRTHGTGVDALRRKKNRSTT